MSSRTTNPGLPGGRTRRSLLHWPAPDTLVLLLLLVIAIIAALLAGFALGAR
ncbi:MAG TPA: hypothetical protein VH419_02035 [Nocardioidaceae bacterium]|jgi:hypothetical protein